MKNNNNDTNRQIMITLENGKQQEGTILFTFETNGEDFVLYELDNQTFAAKIGEDDSLTAINEDEWTLVEKTYNQYIETMSEEKGD